MADIRLTVAPYFELLADMPDSDYEAEGFGYFEEHPELLSLDRRGPLDTSRIGWEIWNAQPGGLYVIRFQLEEVY